jgi:transcriptional regulator with GAF, ATPase, and Fis domain
LRASIEERKFRQDLYFRISDFELHVPSLRDRWEDIPILANQFLAECFQETEGPEFDPPVMDYLINRTYTGNVRELKQLVRRIALKHVNHKKITIGEIPMNDRPQLTNGNILSDEYILTNFLRNAILTGHDLREMKSKTMEEAIKIALELTHGDKQMAAQKLGVTLRAIQHFWKKNKAELED